jgi:hypothetical protein
MAVMSAATLVAAALAGGCGGGNTGTGPVGEPTASAPEATTPPTDATQPGTTAVTPPATTPTQTVPAGGDGDGGDDGGEQEVRVPASFVVAPSGRLTPPTITVPPLLAVEISLRADDGASHALVLRTPVPRILRVAAGERTAVRIPGLRAGRYPVTLDGRRAGTLVAGGEVGP